MAAETQLRIKFLGVTAVDWQLQPDRAVLETGAWRATVNPHDPKMGMYIRNSSLELGYAFGVVPKPSHSFQIQEAYVRKHDLIVRYEQSADDLYAFQLNWRRLDCDLPDSLAIELWISIQTSLLDTHPVLDVYSRFPKAQWTTLTLKDVSVEASDATALGLVKKDGITSLVMIQPSDAHEAKRVIKSDDVFRLQMFGEFMEKGVIRRGRMWFLATTGELSRSTIAKQYRLFTNSPLPLTA